MKVSLVKYRQYDSQKCFIRHMHIIMHTYYNILIHTIDPEKKYISQEGFLWLTGHEFTTRVQQPLLTEASYICRISGTSYRLNLQPPALEEGVRNIYWVFGFSSWMQENDTQWDRTIQNRQRWGWRVKKNVQWKYMFVTPTRWEAFLLHTENLCLLRGLEDWIQIV